MSIKYKITLLNGSIAQGEITQISKKFIEKIIIQEVNELIIIENNTEKKFNALQLEDMLIDLKKIEGESRMIILLIGGISIAVVFSFLVFSYLYNSSTNSSPKSRSSVGDYNNTPALNIPKSINDETKIYTSDFIKFYVNKVGLSINDSEARDIEGYITQAVKDYKGISQDEILASYITLRKNKKDPHSHIDALLNLESLLKTIYTSK